MSDECPDPKAGLEVHEVEEVRVVTHLLMPSRKVKVGISTEFLKELERLDVRFKLN